MEDNKKQPSSAPPRRIGHHGRSAALAALAGAAGIGLARFQSIAELTPMSFLLWTAVGAASGAIVYWALTSD